ncbi:uncharacterized protein EI90DRAFT_2574070 [Cantharellus anzutake]|uniref:uncharacterized protein n=1 Tax=Cantharellus anzutake TaxID=1750568 RepID=UPI0019061152|nr:uncharacterized protein EI90DRAFT_2574070 [Cantharellus anzutake]KAF8321076.1 hypothetical protein EI90DRAFT_2574070 [Cantharellus anzutake]
MGRRKIEIQPILHDRNRSVTFLKRKNGLFKKAFELGVLCSVDVVVVVFGHNQKLYEYSSAANGSTSRILERRRNAKRNQRVHRTLVGTKAIPRMIAMKPHRSHQQVKTFRKLFRPPMQSPKP